MIDKLILKTYAKKSTRGWDMLYWAVDIHDTCIKANYSTDEIPTEFFPLAKTALQRISNRADSTLILFTCSHPTEVEQYLKMFSDNGIEFKYVNENPEVPNTALGCFDGKFYTNFYIEDKAGFDPEEDWHRVHSALDLLGD